MNTEIITKKDLEIGTPKTLQVLIIIVLHLLAVLSIIFYPRHLPLWEFEPKDVVMLLLGLFVVALFIERAVEVIMLVTRDKKEKQLEAQAKALDLQEKEKPKGRPKKETAPKITSVQASFALKEWKGNTKTIALYLTFTIGIILGVAGFRSLQPLVDMSVFKYLSTVQRTLFVVVDIVITGALLGGGSKGIHEMVEAVLNTVELYRAVVKEGKERTQKEGSK
jgi:hypothetical protein